MAKPALALCLTILLAAGSIVRGDAPAEPPATELDRLRRENAELKRQVEDLRSQLDRLRKQYADLIRNGPSDLPATQPATRPAATRPATDGPGLYRVTSGKQGQFTTTLRAKSREDAIDKALATVGKTAMAHDENADLGSLKVERIGD